MDRVINIMENYCWQYNIRLENSKTDLSDVIKLGYKKETIKNLKIKDFTFQYEEKCEIFNEVRKFIEKHEWLGKISLYPTHIFTARYNGILAGVIVMDMPTAFSKLLGDKTKKIERLISRGASISWSPKNLASSLVMFSIKWMVKNTRYKVFTGYSDPEALEIGTIYQACNFFYLGQKAGASYQYKNENGKWVSDRYFRSRSMYKRIAKNLKIDWDKDWQVKDRVIFDKMPIEYSKKIKEQSKNLMNLAEKKKLIKKHKYVYILGNNKYETKNLKLEFHSRNKTYEYPKNRGI